jgi:hypothetical protein
MTPFSLLVLATLFPVPADHSYPAVNATRTPTPPRIDGILDDPVWRLAPVLDGFVQVYPAEGRPASERTEVRILYDDHALYVSFRCFDSHAAEIEPRLGRRDDLPESDDVVVALDPLLSRRSAYLFQVNSAGGRADGITVDGEDINFNWDGVWESRTHLDSQGWTAEFEIPFATLRFPRTPVQTWGFHVRRHILRLDETDDWNLIRATDPINVGRFENLVGLEGAQPGLSLTLLPYASATLRASIAPSTLVSPQDAASGQVGFDAKYALSGTLTLDATINPEFGQVEVDPEVVNLSAFPVYFPEKRPFFLEGLDIFQSAGPLIYTRRIGAPPTAPDPQHNGQIVALDPTARILGATKLSGSIASGTSIGILLGYVDESTATERVGGSLGPTFQLRASPPTFYDALRIWQRVGAVSSVGATATDVVRGSGNDAHVVSVDFDAHVAGDWGARGQGAWSETAACDPAQNPLYHGGCDAGFGSLSMGKRGGELRLFVDGSYIGAEYDPNDLGFLQHLIGNQLVAQRTHLVLQRPTYWHGFKRMILDLSYGTSWNPIAEQPGVGVPLVDHGVSLDGYLRLANEWEIGWFASHQLERYDDDETRLNAVRLYLRQPRDLLFLRLRSNDTRRAWLQLRNQVDVEGGTWTLSSGLDANVHVGQHLQLTAVVNWRQWFDRPRWITTAGDGLPLFGDLDLRELEISLRATGTFTRDLTLQVFGQLVRSAQHYDRIGELTNPSTLMYCPTTSCATDVLPDGPDVTVTSLIVNAILRWEFRPGSTLFLVYTHHHQVDGNGGRFDLGGALDTLAHSAADNVIAVKLSYLWAL